MVPLLAVRQKSQYCFRIVPEAFLDVVCVRRLWARRQQSGYCSKEDHYYSVIILILAESRKPRDRHLIFFVPLSSSFSSRSYQKHLPMNFDAFLCKRLWHFWSMVSQVLLSLLSGSGYKIFEALLQN